MMPNNLKLYKCSKLLLILSFLIATVSSYNRYEGCFRDSSNRVLSGYSTYSPSLTTETCIQICRNHDFAYAGVEYSTDCFCGNTLPATLIDETFCNATCAGVATERCGGTWAIGIYNTTEYTPLQTKHNDIAAKTIIGVTTSGIIALCITIYLAFGKGNTPQKYPDDRTFHEVCKTSKIAWSIIASSLVLS